MKYLNFLLMAWCCVSSVAFGPSRLLLNSQRVSSLATFQLAVKKFLHVDIGGTKYAITKENLDKLSPNRLVSAADGRKPTRFDRDRAIFKHINSFLKGGDLNDQDEEVIKEVRKEAEFYNITELVGHCDSILDSTPYVDPGLMRVDTDIVRLWWDGTNPPLLSATYSPYVREGQLWPTFDEAHEEQLNATIEQIRAKGTAVGHSLDAVVLDAAELQKQVPGLRAGLIATAKLEIETAADQWRMLYDYPFQLREVIALYPGGSFERPASPVRNATHVATMVLSLPCSYTGGDLEITHRDRSFSAEAGDTYWTAVSSDCGVRTLPVTSGVRLLALIDIHKSDLEQNPLYRVFELSESLYFGDGVNRDFTPDSIDPTAAAEFRAALDKELETYSDAIICLQGAVHYHTGRIKHPRRLCGRDRVYYVALKDHYDLDLVYTRVARMKGDRGYKCAFISAEDDVDGEEESETTTPADPPEARPRTLVVVPDGLSEDMSLEIFESRPGEAEVWNVAGLRVRRRQP